MVKSILFMLLLSVSVNGWWDGGHMITAEIAKQEIIARNPELFLTIEKFVQVLDPLCDDLSQGFVQSASWADDIKDEAMDFWFGWHFTDKPNNPSGMFIKENIVAETYNSMQGFKRAVEELSKINSLPINNQFGISASQAIMMRLLLHIVGDIHQPLHNSAMYNATYPNGDQGGNLESIQLLNSTMMNLHFYFDSGALRLDSFTRPLNDEQIQLIEQYGFDYRMTFPRNYFGSRLEKKEPELWGQESFDIAQNFIYSFLKNTNQVTPEWEQQSYRLVQEQITIGGYRLADTLISIFEQRSQNLSS